VEEVLKQISESLKKLVDIQTIQLQERLLEKEQGLLYSGLYKWTIEQELFIIEQYHKDIPIIEMALEFKKRFGVDRTLGAIKTRLGEIVRFSKEESPKEVVKEKPIKDEIWDSPVF